MRTAVAPGETSPGEAPGPPGPSRPLAVAKALAGPVLILVCVLIAMRGFLVQGLLTNQHPDVLAFWLPRSCFLGRSLAAGHIPLWNPFEMAGVPYAADPQSGWLYVPAMLTSRLLPCGAGLRVFIVMQPLLAGLGLYWFLRMEGLGRTAATAGGVSIGVAIAASVVGISLPFSGTLAWTPFVLVGASGCLRARRWSRRLLWAALAAFAWGQVANAHMSHGLVMCSGLTFAYVLARSARDVRAGTLSPGRATVFGLGFLLLLPLANLATLVPRLAMIEDSSLRAGYAALKGTLPRVAETDRPLDTNGIFAGWPFALGATPGAYVGAAILVMAPAAVRVRERRWLVSAFAIVGLVGYALTLHVFVVAEWFRSFVLRLPFGDVYLHNPGRLRYLAYLVIPVLGALGIQGFIDRPPTRRIAVRWLAAGIAISLALPLLFGAYADRFLVLAVAAAATVPPALAVARGREWARWALVLLLSVDLTSAALWSTSYQGGTVYIGLEGVDHPNLVPGPLRYPSVHVDDYLRAGPIARYLQRHIGDGRYVAWIPPAASFSKGYLFTQKPSDWPALEVGRGMLFEIPDTLGYSPIQLPRYWSYIRATNRLPVFYNASVLQVPSQEDVRLLGVRYLIAPEGTPPTVAGRRVASQFGYDLYEIDGWEPRVSVVSSWHRVSGVGEDLRTVLARGFDPATSAIVEDDPGIPPPPASSAGGSATFHEVWPEDVRIQVDAEAPSMVVVRTAWDEGWSATVDGRPAPVLPTDYLLQGVPVPAGHHEIQLTYRDPNIARGLWGSLLVWLMLLAATVAALLLERRRRLSQIERSVA